MSAAAVGGPRLVLLRGEDAYAIGLAVERLAAELGAPGPPLELWRVEADTERGPAASGRLLERLEERVATAPLFGSGTLAVVRGASVLVRERASRDRLVGLLGGVPEGNGLALVELADGSVKRRGPDPLEAVVTGAGGAVRDFPALTRERMERWLDGRAVELGARLGPGAARLLAERVGAYVREGDVDRRSQTELAEHELEKLALYRPGGVIERDDVAALVPEAIPGSRWAFLDAIASRRAGSAATLAERLLAAGAPLQLLVAIVHGRLRELLLAREHLSSGARPGDLARLMQLHPFRAEKLAEAAASWTSDELVGALEGLLELDLLSKGLGPDGQSVPTSDERSALALETWLAERVAPAPSG